MGPHLGIAPQKMVSGQNGALPQSISPNLSPTQTLIVREAGSLLQSQAHHKGAVEQPASEFGCWVTLVHSCPDWLSLQAWPSPSLQTDVQ